jgi:hypothetical protein
MADYPELDRLEKRAWAALFDPAVSKDVAWPLFLEYRAEQLRMIPIQRADFIAELKRKARVIA